MPLSLWATDFVDEETLTGVVPNNAAIGNGWVLDFSDEFNGEAVNTSKWNIDNSTRSRAARPKLGIQAWMWKSDNVSVDNGNLVLKVSKPNSTTMYCGSINSSNKYMTKYGYFEARIKIAEAAKGTHTAFWLQGPEMWKVDGTANDGAEIDIFESAWLEDYTKSVVHIDGYGADHKANTKKYNTSGIHSGYHTFAMHWTTEFMKIYYDGKLKVTYSDPQWVVKSDEYLWLSDGASFGYEGDQFTSQPLGELTNAYVDYIRVWKYDPNSGDGNLVNDGAFNMIASTFWSISSSDIILSENVFPLDGSVYCLMPNVSSTRFIRQTIDVEEGANYHFKMTGRIQNSHSVSDENNHSVKGPATLKAQIYSSDEMLMDISTQSNMATTLTGSITIPAGVNQVTLKISKNWNVAYIDNVSLMKSEEAAFSELDQEDALSLYPNPCFLGQQLTLESDEIIQSYKLYSLSGKLLNAVDFVNAKSVNITVQGLEPGVYILENYTTTGRGSTQSLVVK